MSRDSRGLELMYLLTFVLATLLMPLTLRCGADSECTLIEGFHRTLCQWQYLMMVIVEPHNYEGLGTI